MTVWNRLHEDRAVRESLSIAISEIKRNQEKAEPTNPLECPTKLSAPRRPNEFLRSEAHKRRLKQRQDYENEQQPVFRPKILAKSAIIARTSGRCAESVIQRLYSVRSNRSESFSDATEASKAELEKNRAFLARQETYRDAKKMHETIRSRLADKECSFAPRVSTRSEIISSTARAGESARQFFERLAVHDSERRKSTIMKHAEDANRCCRFVPKINPLSDALAVCLRGDSGEPVHMRLFKQARRITPTSTVSEGSLNVDMDRTSSAREARKSKCYSHIRPRYDMRNPSEVLRAVDRARREREIKSQLKKDQDELREMEECTFQPNVEKRTPRPASPVLVPGIDKFMTLRKRASESPQPERRRSASLLTIPMPFVFGSHSHASL